MLITDVHVGDCDESDTYAEAFIIGLEDMKKMNRDFTALVSIGDNTQSGGRNQEEGFYHILEKYQPLPDERVVLTLGNHDARGPGEEIKWSEDPKEYNLFWKKTAKPLYMEKNARYMPAGQKEVYFDKWLDGYHFIVLNTENGVKDACTLSERQLKWFEEKLAEAEDDRPIFVFVHQPLVDTHWRSNILNGFGLEDEKVKDILRKYPQTILTCGHIHNGFGVTEAVVRDFGTTVEVPSFNGSENGYHEKGIGYVVDVYKNKILYRARNFCKSEWLPEYDMEVKLPVPGVVYQKICGLKREDYAEGMWHETEHLKKELEDIFSRKYDQEGLAWNDSRLPQKQLFTKEIREKADRISEKLMVNL